MHSSLPEERNERDDSFHPPLERARGRSWEGFSLDFLAIFRLDCNVLAKNDRASVNVCGRTAHNGAEAFVTTHWSVVLTAQGEAPAAAQEALEKLCRSYWWPLYGYVRRQGYNPEEAQDLTQSYNANLVNAALRLLYKSTGIFEIVWTVHGDLAVLCFDTKITSEKLPNEIKGAASFPRSCVRGRSE